MKLPVAYSIFYLLGTLALVRKNYTEAIALLGVGWVANFVDVVRFASRTHR